MREGGFKAAQMCVCAFYVCFANWTGIVVEVKRAPLKMEKAAGKEWWGWGGGGM